MYMCRFSFRVSVVFLGSGVLPDAPNEACHFPSVNFFFKSFFPALQSDEAQRLDVYFFAPLSRNAAQKREREQGNHGEIDGETEPTPPPLGPVRLSLEDRVECIPSPPLPFPFPYTLRLHPTLHPAPCTLHPTHCTLHYTLHTAPYTCTLHLHLHTTHYTTHYTLHYTTPRTWKT